MSQDIKLYTMEGKILDLLPFKKGVGKNGSFWTKQEFLLSPIDTPEKPVFIFSWKELPDISVGDDVVVYFKITSTSTNNQWFTNIIAVSIINKTNIQLKNAPNEVKRNSHSKHSKKDNGKQATKKENFSFEDIASDFDF